MTKQAAVEGGGWIDIVFACVFPPPPVSRSPPNRVEECMQTQTAAACSQAVTVCSAGRKAWSCFHCGGNSGDCWVWPSIRRKRTTGPLWFGRWDGET